MKIAYFGGDWHIGCISILEKHGHEISHIFIHEIMPYNQLLRNYAEQHSIAFSSGKPSNEHLAQLVAAGVDCLFSVEYPWLIPIVDVDVFSINVHPTMLPEGRGPTPLIWLLKDYRDFAGITFHKLANEFDQGEIIYQQPIDLDIDESWDSLMLKLHLQIPADLDHLLAHFEVLYDSAKKQNTGSYWPKINLKHRLIDWNWSVSQIKQLALACGRFGVVVDIKGQIMMVNQIETSQINHDFPVGTMIREDEETYVLAATDGMVIIFKANIIERLKTH